MNFPSIWMQQVFISFSAISSNPQHHTLQSRCLVHPETYPQDAHEGELVPSPRQGRTGCLRDSAADDCLSMRNLHAQHGSTTGALAQPISRAGVMHAADGHPCMAPLIKYLLHGSRQNMKFTWPMSWAGFMLDLQKLATWCSKL